MGLEFTADVSPLERTYADMVQQLHDFPQQMAQQLTDWQREDMNRRWPDTVMPTPHSVQTSIWPRSRLVEHHATGKPRGRPKGAKTLHLAKSVKGPTGRILQSQRPILRPELFDKLDARMVKLLEIVSWKTF
jgi:hypothetical protein